IRSASHVVTWTLVGATSRRRETSEPRGMAGASGRAAGERAEREGLRARAWSQQRVAEELGLAARPGAASARQQPRAGGDRGGHETGRRAARDRDWRWPADPRAGRVRRGGAAAPAGGGVVMMPAGVRIFVV